MTTETKEKKATKKVVQVQEQSKTCFVIMPISDADGYEPGHFDRVYNHIIKPACERAGFAAQRADKNNKTNYIVIDILKQIVNSDMAICDLSSRNSNVFFELGLRQAFNLKTVLIKDLKTPRSFDISGLRCIDYDESLRVDKVESTIEQISVSLKETMASRKDDVNSLIQLLAVDAAKIPDKLTLSNDTGIIIGEIKRLREEINHLQVQKSTVGSIVINSNRGMPIMVQLPNGETTEMHKKLYLKNEDMPFFDEFGVLEDRGKGFTAIKTNDGLVTLKDEDELWSNLTTKDSAYLI